MGVASVQQGLPLWAASHASPALLMCRRSTEGTSTTPRRVSAYPLVRPPCSPKQRHVVRAVLSHHGRATASPAGTQLASPPSMWHTERTEYIAASGSSVTTWRHATGNSSISSSAGAMHWLYQIYVHHIARMWSTHSIDALITQPLHHPCSSTIHSQQPAGAHQQVDVARKGSYSSMHSGRPWQRVPHPGSAFGPLPAVRCMCSLCQGVISPRLSTQAPYRSQTISKFHQVSIHRCATTYQQ